MLIHSRPEMLQARPEMIHDHQTAPTQFVEANGIRFAYRRFGNAAGRATRLQPALHRHDGPLGSGGD